MTPGLQRPNLPMTQFLPFEGSRKCSFCLFRRSAALEIANVVSFNISRLWDQHLLSFLTRSVPSGFQPVSIAQIHTADKEFWRLQAGTSFCPDLEGNRPLDDLLPSLTHAPQVGTWLLPRHAMFTGKGYSASKTSGKGSKKDKGNRPRHASQPYWGGKSSKPPGKSKGKGKSLFPAHCRRPIPNSGPLHPR